MSQTSPGYSPPLIKQKSSYQHVPKIEHVLRYPLLCRIPRNAVINKKHAKFLFCASVHHSISQMKHQLDATLCRCTEHSVPALIRRCDDLPATITHVPVAAVLVLNTPHDGRLRPKHVE